MYAWYPAFWRTVIPIRLSIIIILQNIRAAYACNSRQPELPAFIMVKSV
jgi:hypothetical protein